MCRLSRFCDMLGLKASQVLIAKMLGTGILLWGPLSENVFLQISKHRARLIPMSACCFVRWEFDIQMFWPNAWNNGFVTSRVYPFLRIFCTGFRHIGGLIYFRPFVLSIKNQSESLLKRIFRESLVSSSLRSKERRLEVREWWARGAVLPSHPILRNFSQYKE